MKKWIPIFTLPYLLMFFQCYADAQDDIRREEERQAERRATIRREEEQKQERQKEIINEEVRRKELRDNEE